MKSLHPWKIAFLFGLLWPYSLSAVPDPRLDSSFYLWLDGPQVLVWTIPGWKGRELEMQYLRVDLAGDSFTIEPLTGFGSISGEGKIDREKVSISFRLSGPGRYEYLHVADFRGLSHGGARGTLTFGKVSAGVPNVGRWEMRPLPSPAEFEKPAVAAKEEDAIDVLLRSIKTGNATGDGQERYDVARSQPDAANGATVRMWLEAFDVGIDEIIREDVARIEPPLGELPPFESCEVFLDTDGVGAMRTAMVEQYGKPSYAEAARVVPTGSYQPLFKDATAMKGWEESVLRMGMDANGELVVHLALKSREAGRLYGLEYSIRANTGILVFGPVSATAGRRILVWFDPAESSKSRKDTGGRGK